MNESEGPWPHEPVLSKEVIEFLALEEGQTVVDATIGAAGHAILIAQQLGPHGFLLGVDRDPTALEVARRRLDGMPLRVELVHDSFRNLGNILEDFDLPHVDRILMDLGLSSMQLDDPARGMSFRNDGPLDMRFDPDQRQTALHLCRNSSEKELVFWFQEYGEERYAKRVARAVVRAREQRCLPRTTAELAELVVRAVPPVARRQRIHPATRVFQALRIAVNQELEALEEGLEGSFLGLAHEGRLAVISFHSLEDRRVKHFMKARMQPLRASLEERHANPRSRSAKLRVAVKDETVSSDPSAARQEVLP